MGWTSNADEWFDRMYDRATGRDREAEIAEDSEDDTVDAAGDTMPKVGDVDLRASQNANTCNCEDFELIQKSQNTCILRRAFTYAMKVKVTGGWDTISFIFQFGANPSATKGSKQRVTVKKGGKMKFDDENKWDACLEDINGDWVNLRIKIPSDALVGLWRLSVRAANGTTWSNEKVVNAQIYVLFNPWSKDDQVYMEEEERKQEYILEDVGQVWVGSYNNNHGRSWVYGQFDDAVLPATIMMMERSGMKPENRGNPVLVARAISKIVNSNDDSGVITGRWTAPYTAGTAPTAWTGSIKILEQYLRTGKPVKYGQCWVFAAVVTTVCRCLGIPCRPVTNMNSAHDTNASLTIDKYYDQKGEELSETDGVAVAAGISDSIWNFHVWNDVWMARPDLKDTTYGGWQAIDATPQEKSAGIFQCGPAPLEAIRRGDVLVPYDVPFVLAEVNADLINWRVDDNAEDGLRKISSSIKTIGRQVLTKKPGVRPSRWSPPENCTGEYKPPEGSDTERVTLTSAATNIRSARHAFNLPSMAEQDVEIELAELGKINLGDPYEMMVTVKNTAAYPRTILIALSSSSLYYTGVKADTIARAEGTFKLEPLKEEIVRMVVPAERYEKALVEHGHIKVVAMATVEETSQTWVDEHRSRIIKPDLVIKAPDTAIGGEQIKVKISFQNPIDRPLTNVFLIVDGPALTRPKKLHLPNIPAKSTFRRAVALFPSATAKKGYKTLVVSLTSNELSDVTGMVDIKLL